MKTLTLDFTIQYITYFSLKGLSFRALSRNSKLSSNLIKCKVLNKYAVDVKYYIDGNTCRIKKSVLILFLKELNESVPFDNIKIKGHYELSSEQLMLKIKD